MRLQEPAGDLAVAAALASSLFDRALPVHALFVGELGLGGEVRTVSQIERRIAEAGNMGLTRVYLADRGMPRRTPRDVELVGVRTIQDLLTRVFT
jgi:DNA repair protein RadA/Sms